MRPVLVAMLLLSADPRSRSLPRANFLHIRVTAGRAIAVRAVWRPHVGAIDSTGELQQEQAYATMSVPNRTDSMRRWRDSTVRDTITANTPTQFVVDMNFGPIVIETTGSNDSVRVQAQLMPDRGPVVAAWGHSLIVSADGIEPKVERKR